MKRSDLDLLPVAKISDGLMSSSATALLESPKEDVSGVSLGIGHPDYYGTSR